jgi:uncharacterized protein DUF4160
MDSGVKCVNEPTVFRHAGFRFYFFSREEERIHVHVHHTTGEAEFWLEPSVALAQNFGLSQRHRGRTPARPGA